MKRWLRGSVVLATAVGAWSCSGDPTDSFRGDTAEITATPSSIFLNVGETKSVIVQAIDDQGNPLAVDFDTATGPGLTVVRDTNFLPTTGSGPILGQVQYFITANSVVSSTFTVSTGGKTLAIPVKGTPLDVPATFSNVAPAVNEPVTVTASEGIIFQPGAVAIFGADTATTVGVAEDGSTMTFIATPGSTGIPTLGNVAVSFLPDVPLSLPATTEVTVSSTVPALAGTNAPGSAPSIAIPAAGSSTIVFDAGTFTGADISTDGGVGAQYYKLDITEAGDYTFTVNWNSADDIDMELCSDVTCSDGGAFIGAGNTIPETDTVTLEPGTYYFDAVLFAGAAPGWVSLRIDHLAAAAAE